MILKEYALYGLRGRTGTTFLRNQLGKYDEHMCLTTDKQIDFLQQSNINNHISTLSISYFVDHDIKSKFSPHNPRLDKIRKFIYKMPIYKIMNQVSLEYINRIKPIFVLRNPLITVLSTSKKDFLENSDKLDYIFESILSSYAKLGMSAPMFSQDFSSKYSNDPLMQNAVLLKMSFSLYREYFLNFYKGEFLIFSFEDFINNPVNSMKIILEFFDNPYDNSSIENKLNEVYFRDAKEEGGINMSANLNKSRNTYNPNQVGLDKVLEYLYDEMSFLGYSHNNKKFPKTIITTGKKFFENRR